MIQAETGDDTHPQSREICTTLTKIMDMAWYIVEAMLGSSHAEERVDGRWKRLHQLEGGWSAGLIPTQ